MYEFTAAAAAFSVSTGVEGSSAELSDVTLKMRSSSFSAETLEAAAEAKSDVAKLDPEQPFSALDWSGEIAGTASLVLPGPGGDADASAAGPVSASTLTLSIRLTFTIEGGEFKVGGGPGDAEALVIDGKISYADAAVSVLGAVTLHVPCVPDAGRPLLTGTDVAFDFVDDAAGVAIEGGRATLEYPCALDGLMTLQGTAEKVSTGALHPRIVGQKYLTRAESLSTTKPYSGVSLSDVTFSLQFQGDDFNGVVHGVVDVDTAAAGAIPEAPPGTDATSTVELSAVGGGSVQIGDFTANGATYLIAGANNASSATKNSAADDDAPLPNVATDLAFSFQSETIKASLRLQASSACVEKGTKGSGSFAMKFWEEGSFVKGSASVVKRCGEFAVAEGTYEIDAAIDSAEIQTAAVKITLTDVKVNVKSSSGEGVEGPVTFEKLAWTGSVSGTAALELGGADSSEAASEDALLTSMKLSYSTAFSVADGDPKMDQMIVAGELAYSGDSFELTGGVTLQLPCAPGKKMFSGEMTIATKGDSMGVDIKGGKGLVSYVCGGPLTVKGSATMITAPGDVKLTDVEVLLTFDDSSMATFTGRTGGVVELTFLKSEGLLILPSSTVETESGAPVVAAALNFNQNALTGFAIDKVEMSVAFEVKATSKSKQGGGDMTFGVSGKLAFVYPCNLGDAVSGEATLNANVPDTLDVKDLVIAVVYNCGENLPADTARLVVTGSTTDGIEVGKENKVTLKPLNFGASVFTQDAAGVAGTHFAGIVSGSVATEVGSAALGADVAFSFDTRDGSWEAATAMTYTTEKLNATLNLASASACREAGTAGSGSLSVAFGEADVLTAQASVLKRCDEYAVASPVYEMNAHVTSAKIQMSDAVALSLSDVGVSLVSSTCASGADCGASAKFSEFSWKGTVTANAALEIGGGDASSDSEDDVLANVKLSTTLVFSVENNVPKFEDLSVTGNFTYSKSDLELSGKVAVHLPCPDDLSGTLFTGSVKIGFKSQSVKVVNGRGLLAYKCRGGVMVITGSADKIIAGPATFTDVAMEFNIANMRTFDGSVFGTIDVSSLSSSVELPAEALKGASPGAGDDSTEPTPRSSVLFSSTPETGFVLGKLTINVGFAYQTKDKQLSISQGVLAFVHPCETGETASAMAILDANMPGKLEVKAFAMSVVYACGDLTADQPRWTVSGETTAGVKVASATVNPFQMNAYVYNTKNKGVAFGGVLSGAVALDTSVGGVGGGALEGTVSFGFDTRDNSWSAATTMSFTSEMVNATAVVAASSGCTEAGTLGSGSLSMTFGGEGSSNLNAGVTCVKRCGKWADQYGSMIVRANVNKSKIVIAENLVLDLNAIDVKLVGSTGASDEAGGAVDFGAADDDENALSALTWSGALVAEDITLSMPETGLSLIGGVSVMFDIGLDKKPVLKGVDATLVVEYNMYEVAAAALGAGADDAIATKKAPKPLVAVKGSVILTWPCGGDDEESGGAPAAPLLSGAVSIEVNFEEKGAAVHNARGTFTVACGGYPVELDASADSLTFAGVVVKNIAIKITVEVNAAADVNTTYARGSISGKIGYGAASLEAFYVFNTLTGDFTAAVALQFDKPPLFIRVEAEVSNVCTERGNSLRGKLNYSNAPMMVAIANAKGVAHCVDPDNATAPRYEVIIELEELSVADGAFKLTDVILVASGYGTHKTSLKGLEWDLGVSGSMSTSAGTESSLYAVAASADVAGKLKYNPATQTFTDLSLSVDMNVSGSVGTALAFKARALYTYPCKDMIAVTSSMSLDLGDVFTLPDLAGSLTIYCPGMEPSARARRVFSASVALTEPAKASYSGVEYTIDQFVLNVEGKESLDVSPDANAKSWVPLPSLSTVDVEGTILARASVSYDSDDGKKAAARFAAEAELGFKAGAVLALTAYFKKTAGVTKIDTKVNVTASAYFDYASEDGSVEVHLTAAAANTCPPEGNSVKGTFAINKPGVIELDATVSGVQFCADGVEETAFKIEAVVEEALVGGLVSLRSIVITLEISGSPLGRKDVSAEGAAKRHYAGSFKGTVGVEALMELIPDMNANAASVTASGAFVKAPGAALELTEGVEVSVDVDLEFGAGSKITGVAAFHLPCTVDSPPIKISAEVLFKAPLPELNSGKAELIVYCGRGANFHVVLDVDTFEVTEGVVFDHVHVDIQGMKDSSTWNMWAVTGTVVGSGSAAAGGADGGKLLWSGDITFDTGPKGVLQVAEAIEESLPVDFSPPPPTPPSTPPPVAAAFDDSNCCNPNAVANYFLPDDKCCTADTMRVVDGAQCLSSRWCKTTGCFSSVETISRAQKCAELPGDVISPPPPRLPPSPPPQPVSDNLPERLPPAPSLEGCCNANSMDTKKYFTLSGDSCCDTGSLRVVKGAHCLSSRWCKKGQSMDCIQAKQDIPITRSCKAVVAAGAAAASAASLGAQAACTRDGKVVGCKCGSKTGNNGGLDNPFKSTGLCCHKGTRTAVKGEPVLSLAWCKDSVAGPVFPPSAAPDVPAITPPALVQSPPPVVQSPPPVVQEEEAAAAEALYIIKKTYNVDANLALVYSDGNVVVYALGHVHVGSSACEGIQAQLLGNLTIVEHDVKADGNITLHCPAADGSRQIDAAVKVDSWQIAEGVSLVDASVYVEAIKSGGAQGSGSSMSVQGKASGVVKIAAGTGGAPDMTSMGSSPGVDVTIKAQATFKKPACEAVATRGASGAASVGAVKAAAVGGCSLKVEEVIVDVDFSVVKGDDARKPDFWVKGNANFRWPCATGQHVSAQAAFGLNIGEYSIPNFIVAAKLFCNVTDPLMPVFILKGTQSDAPIVLGAVSLENVGIELRAYRQGRRLHALFKPGTLSAV